MINIKRQRGMSARPSKKSKRMQPKNLGPARRYAFTGKQI